MKLNFMEESTLIGEDEDKNCPVPATMTSQRGQNTMTLTFYSAL